MATSCPKATEGDWPVIAGFEWIDGETHVFESSKELIVSVPRETNATYSLVLDLDTGTIPVVAAQKKSAARDIFVLQLKPEMEGSGVLEIRSESRTERIKVSISATLHFPPEIVAARKLRREKRDFSGAEKSVDPLAESTDLRTQFLFERERGTNAFRRGEYREAARWWSRSSYSAEKLGLYREATHRMFASAYSHFQEGLLVDGEEALQRAEQLMNQTSYSMYDRERLAYFHGIFHVRRNDNLSAVKLFQEARQLAIDIGYDADRRGIEHMLSGALADLGSYSQAIEYYREAPSSRQLLSQHLRNRASFYFSLMQAGIIDRDLDIPRQDYLAALPMVEEEKQPQPIVYVLVQLAELELAAGNLDQAAEHLKALKEKYPLDLHGASRWRVRLVGAELAIARGQFAEADQRLQEVLDGGLAETFGEPTEEVCEALILRADALLAMGSKEKAKALYAETLSLIDDLARRQHLPKARSMLLLKHASATNRLTELYLEAGQIEEALEVISRGPSAILGDLNASVQIAEWSPQWKEYQDARHALTVTREKGCLYDLPSEKDRCLDRIHRLERFADDKLAQFYSSGGTSRRRVIQDRLKNLRSVLAADELLLAVHRIKDSWIIFLVDHEKIEVERGDVPPEKWITLAEKYAHIYVAPGERTRDYRPDLSNGTDGAPLAEKITFSYLPGPELLLEKKGARKNMKAPLIVADPDTTLPGVRSYSRGVAARFPGAKLIVGVDATREALLEEMPDRSVFHFIGHASLRGGDPWTTELKLSRGESIGVVDFFALNASLDLVVLEACQTGMHRDAGDIGLPEVLIATGTRSVLATVRDLNPGETSTFMLRFYDANGAKEPAKAMREAIRASEAAGDSSWRAFQLWGER